MNTRQALPQMRNLQSIRYRLHYVLTITRLSPFFHFGCRLPLTPHPPRSLQNNDIKEPVISALLPLLSTRTALRTIELVHCCHQDDGLRVSSSASAHAATQPAVASSCWGNISLLSQLLLLKNVSLRFNFQK